MGNAEGVVVCGTLTGKKIYASCAECSDGCPGVCAFSAVAAPVIAPSSSGKGAFGSSVGE
jgi:hypothetical protein